MTDRKLSFISNSPLAAEGFLAILSAEADGVNIFSWDAEIDWPLIEQTISAGEPIYVSRSRRIGADDLFFQLLSIPNATIMDIDLRHNRVTRYSNKLYSLHSDKDTREDLIQSVYQLMNL